MRRCARLPRNSLAPALIPLLLAGVAPARAAADMQGRPLALLLVVNGDDSAEPVRLIDRNGRLYADAVALGEAGLDLPKDARGDIALDSLPDIETQRDEAGQRLIVTQRRQGAGRNHVALTQVPGPRPLTPARAGLALAYDLTAIAGADQKPTLAGFVEARLFAGGAALATSAALAPGGRGGTRAIRLDSALTLTDPATLFRATVGDVVGTSLLWSRAVRLAGIQMGNDFALRPDLITYPLPSIAGEAAVPSTLDLIAQNGRVLAQAKVEPGDYLLSGIPIATGYGTIGIVLRDASGRQQLRTISLYGAPQLLSPGLSSVAGDMGAVRRGYGRRSNDYGLFAASLSARRGMTPHLTLEGHAEMADGFALAGAGTVIGVGSFGLLSADAAASRMRKRDEAADGYQLGLAFERVAHPISFQLSGRYVSEGYRDVAAVSGDPAPRSTIATQIGFDLGGGGNASLGYTRLFAQRSGARVQDSLSLLTASYSLSLGSGLNLFASGLGDLGPAGANSATLGLSMALGGARSAFAALDLRQGGAGFAAEYRDPAIAEGDAGYRLAVGDGGVSRLLAEGEYRAPIGRLSGAVERIDGRISARIGMRGAILLVDDGIFFADSLSGGFAIVSTGAPGVTVLQDHRPVGRTRRDGRYLVTNLHPWQDNSLAIDPLDLPADARAGASTIVVRPGENGPVRADFAVDRRPAARVLLVDGHGDPLPPGAQAMLNGGDPTPVGYGGVAWLESLDRENSVAVAMPDGQRCAARLTIAAGAVPARLGPVICLKVGERF